MVCVAFFFYLNQKMKMTSLSTYQINFFAVYGDAERRVKGMQNAYNVPVTFMPTKESDRLQQIAVALRSCAGIITDEKLGVEEFITADNLQYKTSLQVDSGSMDDMVILNVTFKNNPYERQRVNDMIY